MRVLDTLKHLVGQNPNKARQGLKKATSFVDEKTGGKYRGKLGKIHDKAEDFIDNSSGRQHSQGDSSRGHHEQAGPTEDGKYQ